MWGLKKIVFVENSNTGPPKEWGEKKNNWLFSGFTPDNIQMAPTKPIFLQMTINPGKNK